MTPFRPPGRIFAVAVCAALVSATGGCAHGRPASLQQLQHRATYDLGCPAQQLALQHIDERTKAVIGCGRAFVYLQRCEPIGDDTICSWEIDGGSPMMAGGTSAPSPTTSTSTDDGVLGDRE